MSYGREGVLVGQSIDLRTVVNDAAGVLKNTDALPEVYIYDSSVDRETIEAEAEAKVYTSATAGPLSPTNITTGFYELTYSIPGGSIDGKWTDLWTGQIEGTDVYQLLNFEVEAGGNILAQVLLNNELIIVELDASIANVGATVTLGADQVLSWSTEYSPLYASPDLLRMEVGPFLDFIPDDTLALMIHWSSIEADYIVGKRGCTGRLAFARSKFVIYDAALRALMLPGASDLSGIGSGNDGDTKSLGDLRIQKGGGSSGSKTTASGIDLDTLAALKDKRDEWERVVNAGGCINPGQGLDPTSAIRHRYDPDRRASGRLWLNPEHYDYPQPGTNVKALRRGTRRGRFGFSDFRRTGRFNKGKDDY